MTARWAGTTSYTAGNIILPTVDNGRCFYCSVSGTSGSTEPAWPGRYPGVADGSATWVPYTIVTPQTLRDLNVWDTTTAQAAAGPNSDTILGNHLLDAIGELEKGTRRFFVNHPGVSWQLTSYGRPILPLPGFRTVASVIWQGSVQTAGLAGTGGGSGYILLPDVQQTGVNIGISFRPLRTPDTNGPWWLSLGGANGTDWFSTGADNPFDPRNYGGGYVYTSVESDTVIVGDGGYAPGSEPNPFVHALEVYASWQKERPLSLLADSAITPQGGILTYSQMPAEVRSFMADWNAGQTVVSVG
jgi:hypothetical protein